MITQTIIHIALRVIVLFAFVFIAVTLWQRIKEGGIKNDKYNTVNDTDAMRSSDSARTRPLDNVKRLFR
jgi:hypothetical protein